MKKSLALVVSGMILITALAMTACTEEKTIPAAKANRVSVSYMPPENPEYRYIYTLLKENRHTLEKIQELLSPFRLPWTLEISLAECDGEGMPCMGMER